MPSGCARRWRTQLPAATTQSTGLLPDHARGGGPCARTPAKPCATSPASAAPPSPQHDLSGITWTVRDPPPPHLRRAPEPTSASRPQRQRSSSTPTSGTPAHTRSEGPPTPFSRHWPPASRNELDGSPHTAWSPWECPSTYAPPATPAP